MEIDELIRVLPPPASPRETGTSAGWAAATTRSGIALPTDYRSFISAYGTGRIDGFLSVLNPFAGHPRLNLFSAILPILAALRELRAQSPHGIPFPLFFEPGGLLPWGTTDNGDYLLWRSEGPPDEWPVVVLAARDREHEIHQVSMTGFLVRVLSRTVRCALFPGGFPSDAPRFVDIAESR